MSDRLLFEVIKYGQAVADICAHVNWRQIEAVEERDAKEFHEQLAEKLAKLKLETRRGSYDADTVYASAAEGLRAISSKRGEEPEAIDEMVKMMDSAFVDRREKARTGRRRIEASLRKTQPGGRAPVAYCVRSST